MNSKFQTTFVCLEKFLLNKWILKNCIFNFYFASSLKLHILMKNFIEICSLGWKTLREQNLIYSTNSFAIVPEGKEYLWSRPSWVTGSCLIYRELNEGCKGLIWVMATEQGTTHTAEALRNPGPWMGMNCCSPWWGTLPRHWPLPAAGLTCPVPAWPRTLAENLIWPDMWLVPNLS